MKTLLFAVILAAGLAPATAPAQMTESFPDKFSLSAGGFLMDYKRSFVAFDSPGTPFGTVVDLADDLDQDGSSRVLRTDAYFRFSPKHRIDLTWFRFTREGQARVEKSLQIGPVQFGAGTDVESKTVSNLLKFGYTYSFYHVEKVELGVGIGFHFIDMQFDADAQERDQRVSEGGLLPLPNLGLIMNYRLSSRFHIPTQFQFFFIEAIDNYRGSMTDFWVGLEYRAFRNFAMGAAFNRFVLEASGYDTDFRGAVNTTFNGLQFYLAGKF